MLLPQSRVGDRRIARSVISVLFTNIKQIMRRKVVLILAVPVLFMMSIFFLMSDIKNIPETNIAQPAVLPDDVEVKRPAAPAPQTQQWGDPNINSPAREEDNPVKEEYPVKEEENLPQQEDSLNTPNTEPDHINPDEDPDKEQKEEIEQITPNKDGSKMKDHPMPERADAVKAAYVHAWESYERYAFGRDELQPLSHMGSDWLGMGLTMVDSIDTMYLMGLKSEYNKAKEWIEKSLNFNDMNRDVSFFETTIRALGGLMSMYDLTSDRMYLSKAKELGNKLAPAFNTPSGYAYCSINLRSGHGQNPGWTGMSSVLSETGTVQMEFSSLAHHAGMPEFREKAMKVYDTLDRIHKPDGLYPVYLDPKSGDFSTRRVTLGALGDSYYEYLLKIWILTGKTQEKYRRMYEEATTAVINQLVKKSTPNGLTYIAEKDGGIVDKMDHLVCFAGAMFALGAHHKAVKDVDKHMELGKEITRTCHEFYFRQKTGLSPEIAKFGQNSNDFYVPMDAAHYILRPETVESYFVLYWITGDTMYQDWGWEAFQAMEKHCRTPDGYAGVRDVTKDPVDHDDKQQSFFMAETLKYLYLLFSPRNLINLDEWVFNTEAHPLKVWHHNV